MPYKQPYNSKTVGTGASKTPASVMGSQGTPAKITPSYWKGSANPAKPFMSDPETKKEEKYEV